MDDPIEFFLTWVEYKKGWRLPDPVRRIEAAARMTEDACRLTQEQRNAVEKQIAETCAHRGWHLHVVNCRSNHVYVVVSANKTPSKKIRTALKAWATRCLKENFDRERENWWAERGSIRHLKNEESLEAAIIYVVDGQDRKPEASARASAFHDCALGTP